MDGNDMNKGVARIAENSTAMRAAMDECELAEAFRDYGGEAVVSQERVCEPPKILCHRHRSPSASALGSSHGRGM